MNSAKLTRFLCCSGGGRANCRAKSLRHKRVEDGDASDEDETVCNVRGLVVLLLIIRGGGRVMALLLLEEAVTTTIPCW